MYITPLNITLSRSGTPCSNETKSDPVLSQLLASKAKKKLFGSGSGPKKHFQARLGPGPEIRGAVFHIKKKNRGKFQPRISLISFFLFGGIYIHKSWWKNTSVIFVLMCFVIFRILFQT